MKKIMLVISFIALILVIAGCQRRPSEIIKIELFEWTPKSGYYVNEELDLGSIRVSVHFEDRIETNLTLADEGVSLSGSGFFEADGTLWLDTRERGRDIDIRISYAGLSLTLEYDVYDAVVAPVGGSHTTIQDAINDLDAPEEIFVTEGVYVAGAGIEVHSDPRNAFINITRPLKLIAEEGAILDANNLQYVINIEDFEGSVYIKNFIFLGKWSMGAINQFTDRNKADVHIHNNWIEAPETVANFGYPIQLVGDDSTIDGNTIYVPDTLSPTTSPAGILVANASNVEIINNTIIRGVAQAGFGIAINYFQRPDVPVGDNPHWAGTLPPLPNMENINISGNTLLGGSVGIGIEMSISDIGSIVHCQDINFTNDDQPDCRKTVIANLSINNNQFIDQNTSLYVINYEPYVTLGNIWENSLNGNRRHHTLLKADFSSIEGNTFILNQLTTEQQLVRLVNRSTSSASSADFQNLLSNNTLQDLDHRTTNLNYFNNVDWSRSGRTGYVQHFIYGTKIPE